MKKTLVAATGVSLAATLAWAVSGGSVNFPDLAPNATIDAIYPSCDASTSGGIKTVTPPAPGTDCNIQPDVQTVSIYRLALCASKPDAPTPSTEGLLASCEVIFNSTSDTGSSADIALNAVTALTDGTMSKPANGTYTHLYVEIDPEVRIKTSVKFSEDMADSNGGTQGVYCWSKTVSTFVFAMNNQGELPPATECAAAPPEASSVSATSIYYNSLKDDSQASGTGFVNTITNLPTTAGGPETLDAYLIDAAGKLVETQTVNSIGTVKRVAAILTLPNPGVVVTDATSSFVLGYNNSKGSQISTQSGATPSRVSKFGNGPFDMTVAVQ